MKTRDYYFKREATLADSDTTIIDIDIADPISAISIEVEATNGATSCVDHEIHDDIAKIELVDGSDVICSVSMSQLKALNFYELGKMPYENLSEVGGEVQSEKVIIHFGRWMDDPNFYLKPENFKNLQLRISNDLTISATAGFATGTGKITVMARIIEEGAGEYAGYMTTKERYVWTSAGSGEEEIDLYRDHPYRNIILSAMLSTYTPEEVVTKVKMTCDGDKYIPFENYLEDIADYNRAKWGYVTQMKKILSADAGTALLDIYNILAANFTTVPALHVAQITGIDAEQISIGLDVLTTTPSIALQTTAKQLGVVASGLAPFAAYALPLPVADETADWFDPTQFGAVKLKATQGAASASCSVVTQQIRK